ncbi:MAG: CheR family methyltransferase [Acidimicrobiales bacterium]
MSPEDDDAGLGKLVDYLQRTRAFDFSVYKPATLVRRIEKRKAEVAVPTWAGYIDYLDVHPEEFEALFNTILINVTGFFRDPDAWTYVREELIPMIVERAGDREPIRVWSAGCSSGEEAYTLAMLFADALGEDGPNGRVKVYATDVDEDALAQARLGVYPVKAVDAVPSALRERYFESTGESCAVRGDLRRSVIFGRQDITTDAPISRLDLLVCRNTLMYFNAEAQVGILRRFNFALAPRAFLFLGRAEMIVSTGNLFDLCSAPARVYAKAQDPDVDLRFFEPSSAFPESSDELSAPTTSLCERAFETATLPQIVLDPQGILVGVNEAARRVFGLNKRDAGHPFQDLEISYRPAELRSLIDQVHRERRTISVRGVERVVQGAPPQYFDVDVAVIGDEADNPVGASVTFTDVTHNRGLQIQLKRTAEELETTNEELQSTNEELETTNEELHSANEELETTNEELRSTNDELESINDLLRRRTSEGDATNWYLRSVIDAVDTGIIVLDHELAVQVWNRSVEEMWGLRRDEVRGQPFFSLDIGLPLDELETGFGPCLEGAVERADVEVSAINRRGEAVHCAVSCLREGQGAGGGFVLLVTTTSE